MGFHSFRRHSLGNLVPTTLLLVLVLVLPALLLRVDALSPTDCLGYENTGCSEASAYTLGQTTLKDCPGVCQQWSSGSGIATPFYGWSNNVCNCYPSCQLQKLVDSITGLVSACSGGNGPPTTCRGRPATRCSGRTPVNSTNVGVPDVRRCVGFCTSHNRGKAPASPEARFYDFLATSNTCNCYDDCALVDAPDYFSGLISACSPSTCATDPEQGCDNGDDVPSFSDVELGECPFLCQGLNTNGNKRPALYYDYFTPLKDCYCFNQCYLGFFKSFTAGLNSACGPSQTFSISNIKSDGDRHTYQLCNQSPIPVENPQVTCPGSIKRTDNVCFSVKNTTGLCYLPKVIKPRDCCKFSFTTPQNKTAPSLNVVNPFRGTSFTFIPSATYPQKLANNLTCSVTYIKYSIFSGVQVPFYEYGCSVTNDKNAMRKIVDMEFVLTPSGTSTITDFKGCFEQRRGSANYFLKKTISPGCRVSFGFTVRVPGPVTMMVNWLLTRP